jgi:lipopolysaccharide biosynthesis protein
MGSNILILENLLRRAFNENDVRKVTSHPEKYPYFGGTMFWARLDAIDPILKLNLMPDDFQSEHGQIDGTTAHAIERMFGSATKLNNKKIYGIDANYELGLVADVLDEKYKYAP